MKPLVIAVIATLFIMAAGPQSQAPRRTRWPFELRDSANSTVRRLPGTLQLDSDIVAFRPSSGSYVLGDGSLGALPAPLVPDSCVRLVGTAELYRTPYRDRDSVFINFTPGASDCGLNVHGAVRGDSVSGAWYQPSIRGYRAKGRFVMWRDQ